MAGPTSYVAERFSVTIPAGSKVDRERGVVEGVRVVGPVSKNGRKYPGAVLAAAAGKFAAPVNVGHHFHPETFLPLPVPPADRFGRVEATAPNADGVNGRLRFNPKHPFAEPFAWACENDPGQFSFSPLMEVRWKAGRDGRPELDADGDRVAEEIVGVASVDIVSDGGTTATIFESRYVMEAAMGADAKAVAKGLETPGATLDFLTQLFAELDLTGYEQAMKDAIMAAVTSAMAGKAPEVPADGADAALAAPALEFLRRVGGKVGKWAAKRLDEQFVAEQAAARAAWVEKLFKDENLPAPLATPTFTSIVAESFGNEARAKELIKDRMTGYAAGGTGKQEPKTAPAGGTPVKLEDITAGWAAG
jgi:hypothetical protein